jgi:hypothetical protein
MATIQPLPLGKIRSFFQKHLRRQSHPPVATAPSSTLSPQEQAVLQFIKEKFNVDEIPPEALKAIAADFNRAEVEAIIQKLESQGEEVRVTDLPLLCKIAKDAYLAACLFDRNSLLAELAYLPPPKTAHPTLLYEAYLLQETDNYLHCLGFASKDKCATMAFATAQANLQSYTERPPLENFSSLNLLRMSLVVDSLQNPATQTALGQLIYKDINETRWAEIGGEINLPEGSRQLVFNAIPSYGLADDKYLNCQIHKFLSRPTTQPTRMRNQPHPRRAYLGGITNFHFHAQTTNESLSASPSGTASLKGKDIGAVNYLQSTDVLITTLGHPRDVLGQPVKSEIVVDVDFYYFDNNLGRGIPYDPGQYIVPYHR